MRIELLLFRSWPIRGLLHLVFQYTHHIISIAHDKYVVRSARCFDFQAGVVRAPIKLMINGDEPGNFGDRNIRWGFVEVKRVRLKMHSLRCDGHFAADRLQASPKAGGPLRNYPLPCGRFKLRDRAATCREESQQDEPSPGEIFHGLRMRALYGNFNVPQANYPATRAGWVLD